MSRKASEYMPDMVLSPGERLQETLEAKDMSHKELAERTGLTARHINEINKGCACISEDIDLRLERS